MLLCPSGASSRPARARHPATRPPFPETAPVREGVRLAVDVGSVRVGVARSDPGGILASPLAPIPVRLVDERFTTTQAHDALRRGGQDSRARRGTVDAAAAAVLLQAALDTERATGDPPGQLVTLPGGADA